MKTTKSYAICGVQRSGTTLLCELMKSTKLAGSPAEYFLNWEDGDWAKGHGVQTREAFLQKVLEEGTSSNGVFGIKLMWNYFHESLSKLKQVPNFADLGDYSALQKLFPNIQFVWIVRKDKVAQAVSWAIAAQTGIYAKRQEENQSKLQDPVFDPELIDNLYQMIIAGELGWQSFFEGNQIEPLKVTYEDFFDQYSTAGLKILDFLGVNYPSDLAFTAGGMVKQRTSLNIEWAQKFREIKQI